VLVVLVDSLVHKEAVVEPVVEEEVPLLELLAEVLAVHGPHRTKELPEDRCTRTKCRMVGKS
jgi:hypothetical protein